MIFTIKVEQDLEGKYYGQAEIEADSLEEAKKKFEDLPEEEKEELCSEWRHSDEYIPVGTIQIREE